MLLDNGGDAVFTFTPKRRNHAYQTYLRAILLVADHPNEQDLAAGEAIPDGARVVDLGDAVIVPGLIDPMSAIVPASLRKGRIFLSFLSNTADSAASFRAICRLCGVNMTLAARPDVQLR